MHLHARDWGEGYHRPSPSPRPDRRGLFLFKNKGFITTGSSRIPTRTLMVDMRVPRSLGWLLKRERPGIAVPGLLSVAVPVPKHGSPAEYSLPVLKHDQPLGSTGFRTMKE